MPKRNRKSHQASTPPGFSGEVRFSWCFQPSESLPLNNVSSIEHPLVDEFFGHVYAPAYDAKNDEVEDQNIGTAKG
jgi:hypothetical protein